MDAGIQRSVERWEMNTRVYYAFIDTAATLKWTISMLYWHKLQNKRTQGNWNKSANSWESSFWSGMISYPEEFFRQILPSPLEGLQVRTKQRDLSRIQSVLNFLPSTPAMSKLTSIWSDLDPIFSKTLVRIAQLLRNLTLSHLAKPGGFGGILMNMEVSGYIMGSCKVVGSNWWFNSWPLTYLVFRCI